MLVSVMTRAYASDTSAHPIHFRYIEQRVRRIMDELKKVDAKQHKVVAELTLTFQSAIDLCNKCGKKMYMRRLLSHTSDAEKFTRIRERLNEASQDLQLGLALDQHEWGAAQTKDHDAAMQMLADIQSNVGELREDSVEVKAILADVLLHVKGHKAAQATAGALPRQLWEIYPEEISYDQNKKGFPFKLGSGAVGAVYRGRFRGTTVAIKQIDVQSDARRDVVRNEVAVMIKLNHPCIVTLLGASIGPEDAELVLELMRCTLTKALYTKAEGVVLDATTKMRITTDVAGGLAYLHDMNVVHRDLKPDNVLLCQRLRAKISDFGLAKTRNTSSTTLVVGAGGTVPYMAPELLTQGGQGKKEVDLYSMAVTINELYSGQPPFHGEHAERIKALVAKGERPPLSRQLPPHLTELVKAGFAPTKDYPDPASRPPALTIYATLLSGRVMAPAPPAPSPRPATRPASRTTAPSPAEALAHFESQFGKGLGAFVNKEGVLVLSSKVDTPAKLAAVCMVIASNAGDRAWQSGTLL